MRRVLFRLWVVGTVVWAAFIFLAASDDTRTDASAIATKAALVPPAVIFAIGAMLVWAFGGFSRNN
jgi:hypothetical protein